MVVMDVFTRRIIGFGVERAEPCGASICRMFNQIIAGKPLPRHPSSDHDPLFPFHRWRANLRIVEVEEIKSIPFVPVSHPFVERLIGTIRREFLDHMLIWNAVDLGRKLEEFRIITTKIAFTSRSAVALQENDLASRRPPMRPWPLRVAAPLPRSVPDADCSVIYKFAMDTLCRASQAEQYCEHK